MKFISVQLALGILIIIELILNGNGWVFILSFILFSIVTIYNMTIEYIEFWKEILVRRKRKIKW